jgi:lysophospholipase L1-like esterase
MPYNQSDGIVLNKPLGIVGKPLDLRSQMYESFAYRDYTSTTEALANLTVTGNPSATDLLRSGHFPIYVTSGGVTTVYEFKDGTADVNLVVSTSGNASVAATAAQVQAAINIVAWGDSLTLGSGGGPSNEGEKNGTMDDHSGIGYPQRLEAITGYKVFNAGIGGEISTQIKDRFLAAPEKWSWGQIIAIGANNYNNVVTVKADIATMVSSIGHQRYIVVGLPTSSTMDDASIANARQTNSELAALYTTHFFDLNTFLVSQYNSGLAQDVLDHARNLIPASLRTDNIHLNSTGYQLYANQLSTMMDIFTFVESDDHPLSVRTLRGLLDAPTNIGTKVPGFSSFKRIAVGMKAPRNQQYIDSNGGVYFYKIAIDGGMILMHPFPATNPGGIAIRSRYSDEGTYANMEIAGTSGFWPNGSGVVWRNDVKRIDVNCGMLVTQETTMTTLLRGESGYFTGYLKAASIHLGDYYYTGRRQVDFSRSTTGFIPPTLLQAAIDAISVSGGAGRGYIGEIVFNITQARLQIALEPGVGYGYGLFKSLAFLTDIPAAPNGSETKLSGGNNINVTGAGTIASPYVINQGLAIPASTLLTGTPFGTNPAAPIPANGGQIAWAFDGITTSGSYYSSENNFNNHLGLTLAAPKVVNKIRVYPMPGIDSLDRATFQGSNTSTADGWEVLFTIPSPPPYSVFTEYTVPNTRTFKYYRIMQSAFYPSLTCRELEFWGYTPLIDTTLNQFEIRSVSASTTALLTDHTLIVDDTAGAVVITLQTAALAEKKVLYVKKIGATNTVTIDAAGAETIDGATTKVLSTQYERVAIQSNGTAWFII